MRTDTAPTIYRHDYQPYAYRVKSTQLCFELDENATTVVSTLDIERTGTSPVPLILNGEHLELINIEVNGSPLSENDYQLDTETLTLFPESTSFSLQITNRCKPIDNSSLMGLYVSGKSLFTQCEAEGFRRITWFPDRPDVMSRFTVTLRADAKRYPMLLSNGNLISQTDLANGRHEAVWEDPHRKPCYLFALVAGDFDCRETHIKTAEGREALLQVYCDRGDLGKTEWALQCLARSVRWDEQRFGLPLDLDRFMIVAARDFNMGAMENKGLNVFNSAYVLADPDTATDASYEAIESVIGHEYFHNWTGNRVTCRDWFQLSLKEGLTVFRDQEFSADMMAASLPEKEAVSARAVKRIDDVVALRTAQFPEDAGPMAHPIRPESYQEIGNFYTATVYEKGAEVIRMQHTLLGEEGFQAGMQTYFRRHDGQAVTCDDFVDAMDTVYRARNPGKDMSVFRRWYSQAGTPRVNVSINHDTANQSCSITLSQRCEPVGVEKRQNPPVEKPPLHIPFALGLLSPDGRPIPLQNGSNTTDTLVLDLTEHTQSWTFKNVPGQPVPSLLRHFSAPVIVEYDYRNDELALLARFDTDPFARWEAGQELATRYLLAQVSENIADNAPELALLVETWQTLASDDTLSAAYLARALALPSERILLEKCKPADPQAIITARNALRAELGVALHDIWQSHYQNLSDTLDKSRYAPDPVQAGQRALRNCALSYLVTGQPQKYLDLAVQQYEGATNMTERMGSLSTIVHQDSVQTIQKALASFYARYENNPLVIDRWFALQATAASTDVDTVRSLMSHPAFTMRNPNRARALLFQFCLNNLKGVHSQAGYAFWAEQVLALDAINPEIAARLARAFDNWRRFAPAYRDGIETALKQIQAHPTLSRNVSEIINKALEL
ncbi:aminopeptidase N [Pusillimonas sp. DMV24BSW_D]|uniref:aminopeptidase N n=1 Tax=Neopusillimonas aestuarii TaxID=2716226 RepID=UPI00140A8045|nr:aminopeptidase N [Pusillimonas sp. DMV24BSW_D]QIM49930.1 aminopeptidase N [Pusillimonas sp. DMV24BSW_D]